MWSEDRKNTENKQTKSRKGDVLMKSYKELTREERIVAYENHLKECEMYPDELEPFESFEEFDIEQEFLDMYWDAETLECLG